MATPHFTDEEITARARQLANEQGPGWEQPITAEERVGKDTAELRLLARAGPEGARGRAANCPRSGSQHAQNGGARLEMRKSPTILGRSAFAATLL